MHLSLLSVSNMDVIGIWMLFFVSLFRWKVLTKAKSEFLFSQTNVIFSLMTFKKNVIFSHISTTFMYNLTGTLLFKNKLKK